MKNKKDCDMMSCGWGYRHELFGLILLIIASVLTVFTCKALGIAAMFLVGLVLYCHKFLGCHCGHSCVHCHSMDAVSDTELVQKVEKAKKAVAKKVKP